MDVHSKDPQKVAEPRPPLHSTALQESKASLIQRPEPREARPLDVSAGEAYCGGLNDYQHDGPIFLLGGPGYLQVGYKSTCKPIMT